MEKRTIRVKPSCFAPEFEMIIPIPTDRDDEEYIDELLDGILSTEFRYNVVMDAIHEEIKRVVPQAVLDALRGV